MSFVSRNHPQQVAVRGALDEVDDRGTDQAFFDATAERFGGFTLDVAAAPHNAKCDRFYTRADDGLIQSWGTPLSWTGPPCLMCGGAGVVDLFDHPKHGSRCRACNGQGRQAVAATNRERVWCNPPYSDCGAWVRKAWSHWRSGDVDLIVMLLPANRVEQAWWQDHVEPYRDKPGSPLRVEFLRGRMRFDRPNAVIGPKGDRPPFGCCLLIWGGAA